MSEASRRFTDREVAPVLRSATELDDQDGSADGSGVGLSLEELREIAREVGISRPAIDRAVDGLDTLAVASLGIGSALAGIAAGHATWSALSAVSARRVRRFGRALAEAADRMTTEQNTRA